MYLYGNSSLLKHYLLKGGGRLMGFRKYTKLTSLRKLLKLTRFTMPVLKGCINRSNCWAEETLSLAELHAGDSLTYGVLCKFMQRAPGIQLS